MTATTLKGVTWNHPRGYLPMEAASRLYQQETGIAVDWDRRSLQDFESFPVAELARRYDLIVIDHPHVGQITAEKCLAPLDTVGRDREFAAIAAGSVGQSFPSYHWQGRQWAFPIDAATQVQAYRPDRIKRPLESWTAMLELAREGRVSVPMRPPHSLMVFYTLAANLGRPCKVDGPELIDPSFGAEIFELVLGLARLVDPKCFEMDPIAVLEDMALPASTIDCAPLIYGYVNYAIDGFRPRLVAFGNIPALGDRGPIGSALGGTGIAVSALSRQPVAAIDFAYFVARSDIQEGVYAAAGGQPGHAAAWDSGRLNASVHEFYAATRASLETAFVRPRHDGYMAFQDEAARLLNQALQGGQPAPAFVTELNRRFADSFRRGKAAIA